MLDRILHSAVIALTVALVLPTLSRAQNDVPSETHRMTAPPSINRPYDVLHITNNGNKVVNPDTGKTVFKTGEDRRRPHELIKLALYRAHVTVIPSGTVKLRQPINVPTSYTTLIVGPDATLVGNEKSWGFSEEAGITPIKVRLRDHVNVFNFGTLDSGARAGVPVVYNGKSGGKTGVNGGVFFSTGEIKGMRAGPKLIDTFCTKVPLVWARGGWGNALLMGEGTEDTSVGFVAGLLSANSDEQVAEVLDVQPRNKRFHVKRVVGSLSGTKDEIIDINNSPNTRVDLATAYGDLGKSKEELIGGSGSPFIDTHKYPKRLNRRYTQKAWINKNSPGTEIRESRVVQKDVKKWKTKVKLPGYPDNLPVLKIKVRLTAVFKDGSKEQVFAKNYTYDLINQTN